MNMEKLFGKLETVAGARKQQRPHLVPDQQPAARLPFGDKGGVASIFNKENPCQHDQNELLRLQYDFDFV